MPKASYAAFLRGITPMNVKVAELKKCFESAGFADVKTDTLGKAGQIAVPRCNIVR